MFNDIVAKIKKMQLQEAEDKEKTCEQIGELYDSLTKDDTDVSGHTRDQVIAAFLKGDESTIEHRPLGEKEDVAMDLNLEIEEGAMRALVTLGNKGFTEYCMQQVRSITDKEIGGYINSYLVEVAQSLGIMVDTFARRKHTHGWSGQLSKGDRKR